MTQFIDAHPVLFGVLAFPVVCTVCMLVLSLVFHVQYRRKP